ncbi:MAG TPA: hypothetical protein PKC18_14570 [Lacipirellulaceae bacterium]|nr:hypothetical protein [Lacipirellulaceae bacterium]HMP07969.1 hypothetical protein [Lacipirellulaceae bacterium]
MALTTAHSDKPPVEGEKLLPERVPPMYRSGTVEFSVPEGGTDQANFDLTSR